MNAAAAIRRNKRILVGVTGGVAAYKSPDLVRRLLERGADVRVVMTEAAKEFITPLTLQAVSGHPVFQYLLDTDAESGMGHIELARWAETIVVAPATANFISKVVHGEANDLLSALILASEAELIIAPAMNQQMWQNRATRENLKVLETRGIRTIGPAQGNQACGENGPGRMTEPEQIAQQILGDGIPQLLAGKSVLITAGPTWEAIDPVRGITNRSSGKMGFSVARAAIDFGAEVTLISGPVNLETPSRLRRINVISAEQMRDQVMQHVDTADIFISVAAVADYRPVQVASQKIKKNDEQTTITLIRNPDILAQVAASANRPFTVGFAAETENLVDNAYNKLKAKNVDMIVANDVAGNESVFDSEDNAVTLLYFRNEANRNRDKVDKSTIARTDKYRLAVRIIEEISGLLDNVMNNPADELVSGTVKPGKYLAGVKP